jgi:phenylpropionate dioxygenase-like ring-hydroxylating dioxygenase large terminal subunit
VFVQRFGDRLKGFENRCAHRFYPLRTKEKGNGPIQCDFHHWKYDQNGLATHIPLCQDQFETTPREMNARIAPIEVATCGSLIFGRFQNPHSGENLDEFLGQGAPIIEAMCTLTRRPRPINLVVEANWKLCYQISLDDYHPAAVHPTTAGVDGYIKRHALRYFRFGSHNAFFAAGDENALQAMIDSCRDGTFRPTRYQIFHFFPNLLIALFRAQRWWYVNLQQYVPAAPGRSLLRSWYYPAPFDIGRGTIGQAYDAVTEPIRSRIVEHYIRKLHSEDNAVVEQLQKSAEQQGGWPRLSFGEQRIRWFEEAYAKAMAD